MLNQSLKKEILNQSLKNKSSKKKWNIIILVAQHDNKSEEEVWKYVDKLGLSSCNIDNKISDIVFNILVDSPRACHLIHWDGKGVKIKELDKKNFTCSGKHGDYRNMSKSHTTYKPMSSRSKVGISIQEKISDLGNRNCTHKKDKSKREKINEEKYKRQNSKCNDHKNINVDNDDGNKINAILNPIHITCSHDLLSYFIKISRQSDPAENYAFFYSGGGLGWWLENDYSCPLTVVDMKRILKSYSNGNISDGNLESQIIKVDPWYGNISDRNMCNKINKGKNKVDEVYIIKRNKFYNNNTSNKCDKNIGGNPIWNIIGFDACLMSTLETAFELSTITPYILTCENYEPDIGMFSNSMVAAFINHTNPIINSFIKRVNNANTDPTDMSLINTVRVCELVKYMNKLLNSTLDQGLLKLSFGNIQSVRIDPSIENEILFMDLFSTLELLQEEMLKNKGDKLIGNSSDKNDRLICKNKNIIDKIEVIKNIITNHVVITYHQSENMKKISAAKNYHGLSFYGKAIIGDIFNSQSQSSDGDDFETNNYYKLSVTKLIPWLLIH